MFIPLFCRSERTTDSVVLHYTPDCPKGQWEPVIFFKNPLDTAVQISYNKHDISLRNAVTGTGLFGTGKESRWLVESGAEENGLITLEQTAEPFSSRLFRSLPVNGERVV